MVVKNAKPRLWFGLHMVEGVAEYKYPDKEPQRILVLENAIKEMDPTYQGCPVFVIHRDKVDVDDFLNQEPDGIVVRSFFNKADGKHWAEFMTFTEEAESRISQGWQLSNAYKPQDPGPGGEWHGVSYDQEVRAGEYEHLAIVPNPRYKESVILTPDQFKAYNSEKEQELLRIANSDDSVEQGEIMFFKREALKNAKELESTVVTLPKSKKDMTLLELVNAMDAYELKMKEPQMANMDHMIEHGGKKMNLQQFVAEYDGLCNKMSEMEAAKNGDMDKEDLEVENEEEDPDKDKVKENEEEDPDKDKEKVEKKENAAGKGKGSNIENLRNAPNKATQERQTKELPVVMTNADRVALGKKKYGSKA